MLHNKILVVEDDMAISNLIGTTLELHEYGFETAHTGKDALLRAVSYEPEVIILDLGLPDMDGNDVITKIRTWSNVPIIVVSARDEANDKVVALDVGADDYLTKPFSVDELLARIRVALRRCKITTGTLLKEEALYKNGDLTIDYQANCVYLGKDELHLTPMEFKLLCLLAKHTGKVLTHNFILKEVWGSSLSSDTKSLRVFMTTLRKKIEVDTANPQYIQTHIGIGYRMLRKEEN